MSTRVSDTVIVGAGPYGLSLAAHLRHCGVDHRVIGPPMDFWRRQMPKGMMLKSDGFASNLSTPEPDSTLKDFCGRRALDYDDTDIPVPLSVFTDYGLDFQRRFVPGLEASLVESVEPDTRGFCLRLGHGEAVTARRVVMAVGISHFFRIPAALAHLPQEFVSHSSAHHDLETFSGRDVTVIGAGASAVGLAALLYEAGAKARLIARKPSLKFSSPPSGRPPTLWRRLRRPRSGIGPGWKSRIMTDGPHLFRRLPDPVRVHVTSRYLGPSSAWYLRDRVMGRLDLTLGASVVEARPRGSRLKLRVRAGDGPDRCIETDHVIAATGYSPQLGRLPVVAETLRARVRQVAGTPRLSAHFESSVPGLYFLGPISANSFGPVMRFAYGADYAARRLSAWLARSVR